MWEIISFGDITTLNLVFNAISSIFTSNSFASIAALVAIFSVLCHMVGSLGQGAKELPFAKLFAGIILFSFGFKTFVDVSFENRYDGTQSIVDNVPAAVAMPASIISQIGYRTLTLTETALGASGMNRLSENGYLSPLKVIANLRKQTFNQQCFSQDAFNKGGVALCESLEQYQKDCTSVMIEREGLYTDSREKDIFGLMKFDSAAWSTYYTTSAGVKKEATCSDAWTVIESAFNGSSWDAIMEKLESTVGAKDSVGTEATITEALEAIGVDGNKSRNLLQGAILLPHKEVGTLRYYSTVGAMDLYENYQSSIYQRNYDWALQGEVWTQMVDVFLTMLEAILYSSVPLVALMTLMGATGVKTLVVYLQMQAVIQLIPTLLLIVQSIIMSQMEDYALSLKARFTGVSSEGSEAYIVALTSKAYELMGLGGFMASTVVPALAMTLVTGSGMAMMKALSAAAAPAKDTDAMPQIANQGKNMKDLSGLMTADVAQQGASMSDVDKANLPTLITQTQASSNVERASAQVAQADATYTEAASNSISSANQATASREDIKTASEAVGSNKATNASYINKVANGFTSSGTYGESQKNEIKGMLNLAASVMGSGGSLSSINADGLSKEARQAWNENITGEKGESLALGLTEQAQIAMSGSDKYTTGVSRVDQQMEQVQEAYQEKQSASESYKSAQNLQNIQSATQNDPYLQIRAIENQDGAVDRIDEKMASMPEAMQQRYAEEVRNNSENAGGGAADLSEGQSKILAFSKLMNEEGKPLALTEVLTGYENPVNDVGSNVTNKGMLDGESNLRGVGGTPVSNVTGITDQDRERVRGDYIGNVLEAEAGENPFTRSQASIAPLKSGVEGRDPFDMDKKEERATEMTKKTGDDVHLVGETIQEGVGDTVPRVMEALLLASKGDFDQANEMIGSNIERFGEQAGKTMREMAPESVVNAYDKTNEGLQHIIDTGSEAAVTAAENTQRFMYLNGFMDEAETAQYEKYDNAKNLNSEVNGEESSFPSRTEFNRDQGFQGMVNAGYVSKESQNQLQQEYNGYVNDMDNRGVPPESLEAYLENERSRTKPSH